MSYIAYRLIDDTATGLVMVDTFNPVEAEMVYNDWKDECKEEGVTFNCRIYFTTERTDVPSSVHWTLTTVEKLAGRIATGAPL